MIRAHQPGSEPIDIPETIPNPVVVPTPTRTPTEPVPKEPVRIPDKIPHDAELRTSTGERVPRRIASSSVVKQARRDGKLDF